MILLLLAATVARRVSSYSISFIHNKIPHTAEWNRSDVIRYRGDSGGTTDKMLVNYIHERMISSISMRFMCVRLKRDSSYICLTSFTILLHWRANNIESHLESDFWYYYSRYYQCTWCVSCVFLHIFFHPNKWFCILLDGISLIGVIHNLIDCFFFSSFEWMLNFIFIHSV